MTDPEGVVEEGARGRAVRRLRQLAEHADDPAWWAGYLASVFCAQVADEFDLELDWDQPMHEWVRRLLDQLDQEQAAA